MYVFFFQTSECLWGGGGEGEVSAKPLFTSSTISPSPPLIYKQLTKKWSKWGKIDHKHIAVLKCPVLVVLVLVVLSIGIWIYHQQLSLLPCFPFNANSSFFSLSFSSSLFFITFDGPPLPLSNSLHPTVNSNHWVHFFSSHTASNSQSLWKGAQGRQINIITHKSSPRCSTCSPSGVRSISSVKARPWTFVIGINLCFKWGVVEIIRKGKDFARKGPRKEHSVWRMRQWLKKRKRVKRAH